MTAVEILRSLPTGTGRIVGKAAGVTSGCTAALFVVHPTLIPVYLGACVAVYGPVAAAVLYRTRPGRPAAEDAVSDLYDDIELCESCESRPSTRSVIADDGESYAVCDDCTPGPTAATNGQPPTLTVVSSSSTP